MTQYSEFNAGVAWANNVLYKLLQIDAYRQADDWNAWYEEIESTYLSIYPVLSESEIGDAEKKLSKAAEAVRNSEYVMRSSANREKMIAAEKYVRRLVGKHKILTRFEEDTSGETGRMA